MHVDVEVRAVEYSFRRSPIVGGIGADQRYWESLEEGVFRMCRCAACQQWMWPALWRCPHCGGWDQQWAEVSPVGTVYSWTRSWIAADRTTERAGELPYVVILAELPHAGGARVLGELLGPEDGLDIGVPVRGTIMAPSPRTRGYASIRWSLAPAGATGAKTGPAAGREAR